MTSKTLVAVEITSITQYISGCKWLKQNIGEGKVWAIPPAYPFKSKKVWWANGYPHKYIFWFKDPKVATMFKLSLPPAL